MSDGDPWDPDWEPRSKPAGRVGGRASGVPTSGYPDTPALPRVSAVDPGGRKPRPPRGGSFFALFTLSALLPMLLAFVLLVGLGLRRSMTPGLSVFGASVLLFFPILAAGGALGFKRGAAALTTWFWSIVLLLGMPYYFPGERPAALGEGAAWLVLPLAGDDAPRVGEQIEELLATLEPPVDPSVPPAASTPLPRAVELPVATPSTPTQPDDDDTIVLPVEGTGSSLKVDIGIPGRSGRTKLSVLFDTGATFTTLDRAALTQAGVSIPASAPTAQFQTANGMMEAPLVLLPALWLADTKIEHVTVAVCEACAQNGSAGLLGLNVTGQFQVTVNNEFGEVLLAPREDSANRQLDVTHWLEVQGTAQRWPTGRVEVEVTARNTSAIAIEEAVVEVECSDRSFAVQLDDVPPKASRSTKVELPRQASCDEYRLILRSARWR